jgi:hypothetical protein
MTIDKGNYQTITKIEGAERLLMTAVDLFFENKDILSIHALSSAAHEVIHAILKTQNRRVSLMKDNPTIKPEKAKEYHEIIHYTQNFLKHGTRDPMASMKYNQTETPMWLFDAIQMYGQLTGTIKFKKFGLFSIWFNLQYKDLLNDEFVASFPALDFVDPQYVKDNYKGLLLRLTWPPELI